MNVMFGLHIADILVLLLYFAGMTAIGIWAARKIKNSDDYFMPRRFGKAMMMMFSFGAAGSQSNRHIRSRSWGDSNVLVWSNGLKA